MPRGAGALFFIQMFSRLAYSVLYSTLVLYATNRLHLSDKISTNITATFIAFNYALHLLGGFIGGRFFSYRSLFSIGIILQVIGCALISIPEITTLYWGLAAFLTGAGLKVTCLNCLLTQLFVPDDKRREAAFLWNYSGMNVGFFIGLTVSGYLQLQNAYHSLFLFAGFGNLFVLLLIAFKWNTLNDVQTEFIKLKRKKKYFANLKGILCIIFLILALHILLQNAHLSNGLILSTGIFIAFVIGYLALKQPTPEENKKIWAYLILALTSLVFWTLYQLVPMALTLFIERNVNRHYFGMLIAPQWVQNINCIVIIFGAPLLSILFTWMRGRGIRLAVPIQFGIALLLIGLSMELLPIGIYFADAHGYINFNWILLSYILQSIGELFISPIGYAMVGQLAPVHLQGLMMGAWLMISGVATTLSGYFSNIALGSATTINPLVTNPNYSHTFGLLGWAAIVTGILFLMFIPFVTGLTQEKLTEISEGPPH